MANRYPLILNASAGQLQELPVGDSLDLGGEGVLGLGGGSAGAPSISFTGDTNTGIYSPGADQVAISTGGSGRLFVDASGNVKISTGEIFQTSASSYIRLDGGTGAGNGANVIVFGESHGSAPGRIALTAVGTGAILASTGGAERLRITSAGLVGVGTSDPKAALHVAGSSANAFPQSGGALWLSDTNAGLNIKNWSVLSNSGDYRLITGSDTYSGGELAYKVTRTAGAGGKDINEHIWYRGASVETMRLDSSGRLGIGTSSPLKELQINATTPTIRLEENSAGAKRLELSVNSSAEASIFATQSASQLLFGTVGTERMRIDSSGRLGIGTSSPSSRFNIFSANNDLTSGFLQDGATTGYSAIQIKNTSGNTLIGVNGSTAGTLATNAAAYSTVFGTYNSTNLHLITNDIVRATVDTSGNVGIGTTSPTRLFHTLDSANTIVGRIESGQSSSWLQFAASGNGTASRIGSPDGSGVANLAFMTNDLERARIDSSGRLLVGTSTAFSAAGFGTPNIQAVGNYDQGSILSRNTSNDNTNCGVIFQKIRGSSVVQNNDYLGEIRFNGYDGTADRGAAQIYAQVDGTPGVNDMPGRLVFSTTADGASSPTERMRITSAGLVGIGTSAPAQLLHVKSSSAYGVIVADNNGATGGGLFSSYQNGAQKAAFGVSGSIEGNTTSDLGLFADSTGGAIRFYTNGSPVTKAILDSTGRLGIGTTSPLTKLDVRSGVITAGSNSSPNGTEILRGYYSDTDGALAVIGTEYSSGGIVIGSAVKPSTSSAGAFFSSTNINIARGAYTIAGNVHKWYIGSAQTVAENSSVSTSEVMRIDSSGRVGIGSTAPNRKLEVSDATVDNFIRVNTTNATKSGIEFANGGTVYSQLYFNNVPPYDLSLLQQYITGSLILGTNNQERARIDSSGRLLVGTSSARTIATQSLAIQNEGTSFGTTGFSTCRNSNDIYGPYIHFGKTRGASVGSNTLVSSGDDLGGLIFGGGDGTDVNSQAAYILCQVDGTPGVDDMPGRLVFSTTADGASSPTERVRITNVGALKATTTGSYSTASTIHEFTQSNSSAGVLESYHTSNTTPYGLYVKFTAIDPNNTSQYVFQAVQNTNTNIYTIWSNGTVTARSDAKYKKNVETARSGYFDDLNQLRVVKYNWYNHDNEAPKELGFIAQEVEEVFPGLVMTEPEKDADGNETGEFCKSIKFSVFTPMLVKALQEAHAKIEQLEARLSALESA